MTDQDHKHLQRLVHELWVKYDSAEKAMHKADADWSRAYQELYREDRRRAQAKGEKGTA